MIHCKQNVWPHGKPTTQTRAYYAGSHGETKKLHQGHTTKRANELCGLSNKWKQISHFNMSFGLSSRSASIRSALTSILLSFRSARARFRGGMANTLCGSHAHQHSENYFLSKQMESSNHENLSKPATTTGGNSTVTGMPGSKNKHNSELNKSRQTNSRSIRNRTKHQNPNLRVGKFERASALHTHQVQFIYYFLVFFAQILFTRNTAPRLICSRLPT